MKINIVCNEDNSHLSEINDTIKMMNSLQNYYFYSLINEDVDDIKYFNFPIDWNSFKEKHKGVKNKIYITERPFSDNWFSHEERNFSLITISDWETVYSPPSLICYLIYQIAQTTINFVANVNEDMLMRMVHQKAEGCLFDFCGKKSDIKIGMVAGSICPTCKAYLLRFGISNCAIDAVEKMISFVRASSIGRPMLINTNEAFVIMRFTRNDENDHAYQYGIKDALENLGLDVVRADNKIETEQILKQVTIAIERSRFIIVKVDSNNLNVYFELGYAMGLSKDILLICEENEIANLPTDLNNVECLTYPNGDYKTLSEKITKYYVDNYHIGF